MNDRPPGLTTWRGSRVHQAEGVLKVRLGLTIDEAAYTLQVYAERTGVSVHDAADDVLERGLAPEPQRLDPWDSC
jgi:ANTAR domain